VFFLCLFGFFFDHNKVGFLPCTFGESKETKEMVFGGGIETMVMFIGVLGVGRWRVGYTSVKGKKWR
jgi:hypothetical protein